MNIVKVTYSNHALKPMNEHDIDNIESININKLRDYYINIIKRYGYAYINSFSYYVDIDFCFAEESSIASGIKEKMRSDKLDSILI